MSIVFPTLYDRSKNGKTKQWTISVKGDTSGKPVHIIVHHGYTDGKKQTATETITVGKNIGKANETTPYEQAISQAQSEWQKKCDKGYVENLDTVHTKAVELLPMLAHKFSERGHNIVFPCYTQPKLNGVRAMAQKVSETEIVYHSRGGKTYPNLPHITAELLPRMSVGEIFDGELFFPAFSLQRITSAVKKANEDTPKIQYWVYDKVDTKAPFVDRAYMVDAAFGSGCKHIVVVDTDECNTIEDVHAAHAIYTKKKFEGTMVRNRDSLYLMKHRSADLLKLKDFQDAEFEVVGCKQGVGKFEGVAIFQCKCPNGELFDVVCEGTMELKRMQWKNQKKYLGKLLTVRFQDWSDEGKPLFPVGVAFRAEEDLG